MRSDKQTCTRVAGPVALLAGVLAASIAPALDEETDAVAIVARFQQSILDADARLSAAPFDERYEAFGPIVTESHDLDYMARLAISRAWGSIEPAGREQFVALFRELSIASYARQFTATEGARFRVEGQRTVAGGRIEVQTVLSPLGEDEVPLVYVLHATEARWRIINVLAEGVSDLALKRSQYQQILKAKGFEALLAHLQEQIDDLRSS